MERQTISRKKAAENTSVSTKTIDRWISSGRIEAYKPFQSNRVLIYSDSITAENLQSIIPKFINSY